MRWEVSSHSPTSLIWFSPRSEKKIQLVAVESCFVCVASILKSLCPVAIFQSRQWPTRKKNTQEKKLLLQFPFSRNDCKKIYMPLFSLAPPPYQEKECCCCSKVANLKLDFYDYDYKAIFFPGGKFALPFFPIYFFSPSSRISHFISIHYFSTLSLLLAFFLLRPLKFQPGTFTYLHPSSTNELGQLSAREREEIIVYFCSLQVEA